MPQKYVLSAVWAVLLVLLFSMFGLGHTPLRTAGTILILACAVAQMSLVMLFFMRLRFSPKLVCLFAAAGFFWLSLMVTLMMSDYLTRQWH